MGSLKSPSRTSYRLSIETIALNCLVFEKNASSIRILGTHIQTDEKISAFPINCIFVVYTM